MHYMMKSVRIHWHIYGKKHRILLHCKFIVRYSTLHFRLRFWPCILWILLRRINPQSLFLINSVNTVIQISQSLVPIRISGLRVLIWMIYGFIVNIILVRLLVCWIVKNGNVVYLRFNIVQIYIIHHEFDSSYCFYRHSTWLS